MGPGAAAILQTGIGAVAGFIGSERRNKTDQVEAQKNRDFQERMRNTQWQSAVEDMRQAGINPAIAYQKGGNAAPSGSTPPAASDSVSSASQAARAAAELKLMRATAQSAEAKAAIDTETARVQSSRAPIQMGIEGGRSVPAMSWIERMATMAEDEQLLKLDASRLGLTRGNVNLTRDEHLRDISGVGASLANTFGMWGPIMGALAAPGGVGVSSAKGFTNYLRRRAAMRAVRRAR